MVHLKVNPYRCDECGYSCKNKSMLRSHMKTHSNVYQYRCAYNGCKFVTKYYHALNQHLAKYVGCSSWYHHQCSTVVLDHRVNRFDNLIPVVDRQIVMKLKLLSGRRMLACSLCDREESVLFMASLGLPVLCRLVSITVFRLFKVDKPSCKLQLTGGKSLNSLLQCNNYHEHATSQSNNRQFGSDPLI